MINADLYWYFIIPLFLSTITIFVLKKFVSDMTWLQCVGAGVGGVAISMIIISICFFAGKGSKTSDTQVFNGEVVSKQRVHDSYVESYECNCYYTTDSKGNSTRHCSTCYRDHYTVDWSCQTNIGNYTIEHLDELSKRVYKTPDPRRYTIIQKGDPVSRTGGYTNYIKAVPETLFRPAGESLRAQFKGKIPAYPIRIYDFYHLDRVLPVGVSVPNIREWNTKLHEALKKLGPKKQANVVIVLVNQPEDYFYALQDAWLNGKKNDIIVVISSSKFPGKADWVNIMALTTENVFQVRLRDSLLALDTLTADSVIGTIERETYLSFKRKSMKDFAYLEAEIDPPTWLMVTCVIFIVLAYIGFWIFMFVHRDGGSYNSYGMPRMRRSYPY